MTVETLATAAVNLCEKVMIGEELVINHTYMDLDMQVMILDMGALLSIVGVSWMTQYLEEFDLTIDEMKSVECQQSFRFGPSKRYIIKTLVEPPVLVTRLDGGKDILVVQTYLGSKWLRTTSCTGMYVPK